MDDFDLYLALSGKEKTALSKAQLLQALKNNKTQLIGGAAGAAAGGALAYALGKRWDKKPSYMERNSGDLVRHHSASEKIRKKERKDAGFTGKLTGVMGRTYKDFASLAGEHPVASAALLAPGAISPGISLAEFIAAQAAKIKGIKKP